MYQSVPEAKPHTGRLRSHVARSLSSAVSTRGKEGGAALVEFALVLPLIVTLLLGAVDMGFYLNDTSKLRSAVREAGRRASARGYGNTVCPATLDQYEEATYTSPSRAAETSKVVCLTKLFAYEAGLDARVATRVFSFDSNGVVLPGRDQLWNSGNALVVCAQIQSRSRTGLLGPLLDNQIIESRVVMRISDSMVDGPGEAAEAPLNGDWSRCTVSS